MLAGNLAGRRGSDMSATHVARIVTRLTNPQGNFFATVQFLHQRDINLLF